VNSADVIVGVAMLALAVAGAVAAWAIRINKGAEALKAADHAQKTADEAKQELAAHKLWVAENYVSHTAMFELERRLTDAIKEVGARVERLFHPPPPAA
jgi:ABC-type hemin transport system substrate-binding protein